MSDFGSSRGGNAGGLSGGRGSLQNSERGGLQLGERRIGKAESSGRPESLSGSGRGGAGNLKPDRGAVDATSDRGSDRGAGLANRETARGDRGGRDGGDLESGRRGDGDRGPGADGPGRNSDLASTGRGGDDWRDGRDGRGDWDRGGRGDWDRGGRGDWDGDRDGWRNNRGGWNGRHWHRHNNWHRGFWQVGLWGFNPWWGGWGWGGGWGSGWGWGSGLNLSFGYGSWWGGGWGWNDWGYSPLWYNSGYYGYYNPYCTEPLVLGSTVIDYSQPIVVAQGPTVVSDVGDGDAAATPAMADFDAAREAFYGGNFPAALEGVDRALQQTPDDAVLHEFRALVLFAQGDYQQAAATVSSVLAAGPGWDWDTLRGLYPDVATYTRQLRALESYARGHATAADARFLLAYHYLTCGHTDAAVEQLKRVTALQPSDTVARQLLKSMSPESQAPVPAPAPAGDPTLPPQAPIAGPVAGNDPTLPPAPPGAEVVTAAKPVTAESLVGAWNASREDGSTFALSLGEEGTFNWDYKGNNQENSLKGKYTLAKDLLVLEPDTGGAMVGRVTSTADGQFNFRLVDGPPGDEGLTFKK